MRTWSASSEVARTKRTGRTRRTMRRKGLRARRLSMAEGERPLPTTQTDREEDSKSISSPRSLQMMISEASKGSLASAAALEMKVS